MTKNNDKKDLQVDGFTKEYASALLKKGHDISFIKKDLYEKGYNKEVVEEIITTVNPNNEDNYKKEDKNKEKKDIDSLKEKNYSYSIPKNKEEPTIIQEYIKEEINPTPITKKEKRDLTLIEKLFILVSSLALIFLIIWTSNSTGANIGIIVISFMPTFIIILLSIFFFQLEPRFKLFFFITPIILAIIFYGICISGQVKILNNIDHANVTAFNFMISLIFIILLSMLDSFSRKVIKPIKKKIVENEKKIIKNEKEMLNNLSGKDSQTTIKRTTTNITGNEKIEEVKEIKTHSTEKELSGYMRSIEDTSKALNFAIGRVYSNKRGGSPQIRDKIKINNEWYNLIADIGRGNMIERLPELRNAIYQIGSRLNTMYLTEKQVFPITYVKKFNLEHDINGEEKIIDVLAKNDKDPISLYYQTAVDYCNKAIIDIDSITMQPNFHLESNAKIVKG
jgi:hypothetical protein